MLGNRPTEDDEIYPTLVQLGTVFGQTAAHHAVAVSSAASDLNHATIVSSNINSLATGGFDSTKGKRMAKNWG